MIQDSRFKVQDSSDLESVILNLQPINGAGKTTTLRTIMGMWHVSQGNIFLDDMDISVMSTPEIARMGIAYVPEDRGIFAGLTVRENMTLAARSGRIDEKRLERIFTLFPALKQFWDLSAGALAVCSVLTED